MKWIKKIFKRSVQFIILIFKIMYSLFLYRIYGLEAVCVYTARQSSFITKHILKKFKASIGKNVDIQGLLSIHKKSGDLSNLIIGDNCHIGKNTFLDLSGKIIIEKNSTIAMGTTILTHIDVGRAYSMLTYPRKTKTVIIREGSYIGACAIVLPGVIINRSGFVAAGSVVLQNVKINEVVAGVPAKKIKNIKYSRKMFQNMKFNNK